MTSWTALTEIIGFAAAAVGTSLMLPQVVQSIKTKRVDDISFGMLWLYFFNCLLWLMYGILILAWPIIVCNSIALLVGMVQLFFKFRYKSNKPNRQSTTALVNVSEND